jgi:hypothetical protein
MRRESYAACLMTVIEGQRPIAICTMFTVFVSLASVDLNPGKARRLSERSGEQTIFLGERWS